MTNNINVEYDDKTAELTITDEELDNVNFVRLIIGNEDVMVSIEDLHCALMAFVIKKDRVKE